MYTGSGVYPSTLAFTFILVAENRCNISRRMAYYRETDATRETGTANLVY